MSAFGFTFDGLHRLEVDELRDLACLIRGEDYYPPHTKEALIRGIVIPFLRDGGKAPDDATKDQVMRTALIRVATSLDVLCDDWESAGTDRIAKQVKYRWDNAFLERLKGLDKADFDEIMKKADEDLQRRSMVMGLSFFPAAGIIAGELSGFGIFLATTTGLGAISTAIGVTFPWAVYQGATTLLGLTLGPIGWVLAGTGVAVGGAAFLSQWIKQREQKLQIAVIAILHFIGTNPYEWFGLAETASIQSVKTVYRAMMKTFHPDLQQQELPEWLKMHLNELLLRTQEDYEQVQKHWQEVNP